MPTLAELVASPALRGQLESILVPSDDRRVRVVELAERVARLERAQADSLVLLTGPLSSRMEPYSLDVGLRLAGERKVSGVVLLSGQMAELPATTTAIAKRAGVAVLRARPDVDPVALGIAIQREIDAGVDAWVQRALEVLPLLDLPDPDDRVHDDEEPRAIVSEVGATFGVPIEYQEVPAEGVLSIPVVVNNREVGYVWASSEHGAHEGILQLVLQLTAQAAALRLGSVWYAQEAPVRSRAELLTELLLSEPREVTGLLRRARMFGVPVDGWHVAVHLELENVAETVGGDDIAIFECTELVGHIALQTARATGGLWHRAGAGTTLLLMRMSRTDPGPRAATETAEVADRVLQRIRQRLPGLDLRCGVSTVHAGATGLRAAVAEARAAAAEARARDRVNTVSQFDAHGIRRMLMEWYASDAVQVSVRELLDPLEKLGPERSSTFLETLQTYLDNQGSYARTAELLHLHRNTVKYRIDRVFEILDVDPDDADQLLLLQLACRVRGLP